MSDEKKQFENAGTRLEVRHYSWHEFIRRFAPVLKPFTLRIILSMICIGLVGIAVAVQPLFPKYVIDTAIPQGSLWLAVAAAVLFVIIQFSRMGFWYIARISVLKITQTLIFHLRSISFRHLQFLGLSFHSRFSSGFLYERVFGSSIQALGTFSESLIQGLALHITGLIFSLSVCFWFSWQLTLVILAGATAYVFAARKLAPRIYMRNEAALQAHMLVTELIMDRLHGHKTIQAYAMEQEVQEDFDKKVWVAQEKWITGQIEKMRFDFVSEGIGYLLTALIVVGGAWMVLGLDMQIGVLVAFVGYQTQLIWVINSLTGIYGQFTTTRVAFDQLFTILDMPSDVADAQEKQPIPSEPARLEINHVCFSYIPGTEILKDVSFRIKRGEMVALAGRSGCGKTTLTNLLLRFYDTNSGNITLDGKDIRKLPIHDYRKLFSVVLQDPYLFDDTIRRNLAMVAPHASEADMIDALKRASAWDFVSQLDGGLDFPVGEGGRHLSGGQRQRIAVARCLLLKSHFTLLDEATSALDPESEATLQRSFRELSADRGVLIIAHRLNTLRCADRIVVMDCGKVVEVGTYDELCAANGLFAELNRIAMDTGSREERLNKAGFV